MLNTPLDNKSKRGARGQLAIKTSQWLNICPSQACRCTFKERQNHVRMEPKYQVLTSSRSVQQYIVASVGQHARLQHSWRRCCIFDAKYDPKKRGGMTGDDENCTWVQGKFRYWFWLRNTSRTEIRFRSKRIEQRDPRSSGLMKLRNSQTYGWDKIKDDDSHDAWCGDADRAQEIWRVSVGVTRASELAETLALLTETAWPLWAQSLHKDSIPNKTGRSSIIDQVNLYIRRWIKWRVKIPLFIQKSLPSVSFSFVTEVYKRAWFTSHNTQRPIDFHS